MFNDVTIKSAAKGGSELAGTFNQVSNSKGLVLLSHNAHGSKEVPLIINFEANLNTNNYSTLRYNFHYVDTMPVENAVWEDLLSDINAAYSLMMSKGVTRNVFMIGSSIGGSVTMEYAIRNDLRCPIIILGFDMNSPVKYITEARLKDLKAPLLVLHGEKDRYSDLNSVRTLLGKSRLNFNLFEIKGASHTLKSADEAVRTTEDIFIEVMTKSLEFIEKNTIA